MMIRASRKPLSRYVGQSVTIGNVKGKGVVLSDEACNM